MNEITATLAKATSVARDAVSFDDVRLLPDATLLESLAAVEQLGRTVDALRVAMAAEIGERSRPTLGLDRLSAKNGCRNANELIARVTQVAETTAARWARAGAPLRPREQFTGESLPAKFAIVANAVADGRIGYDTATAITSALSQAADRAEPAMLVEAERALVASALGLDATTGEPLVPFTADQTRIHALQWQVALDPDGARPLEAQAMLQRGITRVGTRGDIVRYRMDLLPEIAGKLEAAFDSCLSPKTTGRFLSKEERERAELNGDSRSPAQQRHDVFSAIVDAAARSGQLPTVGGGSPTVLVSVSAEELTAGRGAGWIDGIDRPISLDAVKQFCCTGGFQKAYFDSIGCLVSLGAQERCFTPQQRRGITVRDGGCVIPGCAVPAGWCEIHHVEEWAKGGPTHTSNGVLLCWFHHRTIEHSGWQIRMLNGVPEVRAPHWIDHERTWRRASKSRALHPPRKRQPMGRQRT
jgi:hypothetical protein